MSAPVEFRHYMRTLTLQDVHSGVQPIRMTIAGPDGQQLPGVYAPPTLQFRYKEKSEAGVYWTDWQDVPLVREGDDILAQMEVPAGARGS